MPRVCAVYSVAGPAELVFTTASRKRIAIFSWCSTASPPHTSKWYSVAESGWQSCVQSSALGIYYQFLILKMTLFCSAFQTIIWRLLSSQIKNVRCFYSYRKKETEACQRESRAFQGNTVFNNAVLFWKIFRLYYL